VPSLARLRYRSSNRTYAAKTVKDIVASVLASAGITSDKISWQLAGSYPVRDITIQYRETDLAFVSRLLEDAGIHYHFDGDLVVFNDGNAGLTALSPSALTYSLTATPSIYSFRRAQAMTSGTVNARDFYFVTPSANLTGTSTGSAFTDLPEGMLPAGAGVTTAARAKARADIRLAARTAAAQGCGGQSSYTHLRAGSKFTLAGHPRAGFNVEYLVTAVDYSGSPAMLRGSFSCLPATVSYRTPPVTPAPVISGVVSAIVVGPSGETKYVDQYGRINVRFPWRLSGDSSVLAPGDAAWVRVVQPAGGMLLPSVGEEVMVAFEHGDPDRPVVIGTVFNAEHMPPVALPANKNRAILTLQ
jgi:type VI secretion system secreted protein VgrG